MLGPHRRNRATGALALNVAFTGVGSPSFGRGVRALNKR